MKTLSATLKVLTCAVFIMTLSSLAQAQATRTWVSGVGDDVNPCSRTAPCKTFAGAISKTAATGEISVLDPGGYGAVTITKGITLNGTGTLASILSSGTTGVNVNVTTNPSTATVILRDISINGAPATLPGINGITYSAGKTLMVDHCWIYGFQATGANQGRGINVSLATTGNLKVIDTVIENNFEDGIRLNTTSGQVVATIERSRIMNNGQDGVDANSNARVLISNSVLTHNGSAGVRTSSTNNEVNLDHVEISFSSIGIVSSSGSIIRVSDTVIAQNATGLSTPAGSIFSFQGNSLMGNPTPGAFTAPTTNKQ